MWSIPLPRQHSLLLTPNNFSDARIDEKILVDIRRTNSQIAAAGQNYCIEDMEVTSKKPASSLFDVYLRLRPHRNPDADRFLETDGAEDGPTHITITPPSNDHRRRAVEKFAFTRVFDERSSQLDVLNGTTLLPLIEGVLAPTSRQGRDGLLATLGVTGSGKSHTILGSRTQRGLTQMSLDILFKSIGADIAPPLSVLHGLMASDVSEAHVTAASTFLDSLYSNGESRMASRAQTPLLETSTNSLYPVLGTPGQSTSKRQAPNLAHLPHLPAIDNVNVCTDADAEYAIVISMYEVYNNKIFDLLNGSATKSAKVPAHQLRRRELLFKSTEHSPERKIVAGLRKIVCGSLEEALLVLETGLTERRIASTGSNAVSSRSHGFFCVEVKKRSKAGLADWSSSTMTIVDLAGSERARDAKTAGTTLAEAGKINESLMYLGQCMQMQSDNSIAAADLSTLNPKLVPFRQCKLTELLFSNSFKPSPTIRSHRPQKAVMIVTADPHGDFNATSQILRYSALAREVTVPRIPSVTSTIGLSTTANSTGNTSRPTTAGDSNGSNSPVATRCCSAAESSYSALTNQLEEELAVLRVELEEETRRRHAAEESWARAEELRDEIEMQVRQECWEAFEARLTAERQQWQAAQQEQIQRTQQHLDRKLDLLARGLDESATVVVHEDDDATRFAELECENARLRELLERAQRQKDCDQSPSKPQRALRGDKWALDHKSHEIGGELGDENVF